MNHLWVFTGMFSYTGAGHTELVTWSPCLPGMNASESNEINTSFNAYRNDVNRVYLLKISVSRSSHVLDSLKGPKRSLGQRFKNAASH